MSTEEPLTSRLPIARGAAAEVLDRWGIDVVRVESKAMDPRPSVQEPTQPG